MRELYTNHVVPDTMLARGNNGVGDLSHMLPIGGDPVASRPELVPSGYKDATTRQDSATVTAVGRHARAARAAVFLATALTTIPVAKAETHIVNVRCDPVVFAVVFIALHLLFLYAGSFLNSRRNTERRADPEQLAGPAPAAKSFKTVRDAWVSSPCHYTWYTNDPRFRATHQGVLTSGHSSISPEYEIPVG